MTDPEESTIPVNYYNTWEIDDPVGRAIMTKIRTLSIYEQFKDAKIKANYHIHHILSHPLVINARQLSERSVSFHYAYENLILEVCESDFYLDKYGVCIEIPKTPKTPKTYKAPTEFVTTTTTTTTTPTIDTPIPVSEPAHPTFVATSLLPKPDLSDFPRFPGLLLPVLTQNTFDLLSSGVMDNLQIHDLEMRQKIQDLSKNLLGQFNIHVHNGKISDAAGTEPPPPLPSQPPPKLPSQLLPLFPPVDTDTKKRMDQWEVMQKEFEQYTIIHDWVEYKAYLLTKTEYRQEEWHILVTKALVNKFNLAFPILTENRHKIFIQVLDGVF